MSTTREGGTDRDLIKERLAKLKTELATKKQKLAKYERAQKAKAHVRQKLEEQAALTARETLEAGTQHAEPQCPSEPPKQTTVSFRLQSSILDNKSRSFEDFVQQRNHKSTPVTATASRKNNEEKTGVHGRNTAGKNEIYKKAEHKGQEAKRPQGQGRTPAAPTKNTKSKRKSHQKTAEAQIVLKVTKTKEHVDSTHANEGMEINASTKTKDVVAKRTKLKGKQNLSQLQQIQSRVHIQTSDSVAHHQSELENHGPCKSVGMDSGQVFCGIVNKKQKGTRKDKDGSAVTGIQPPQCSVTGIVKGEPSSESSDLLPRSQTINVTEPKAYPKRRAARYRSTSNRVRKSVRFTTVNGSQVSDLSPASGSLQSCSSQVSGSSTSDETTKPCHCPSQADKTHSDLANVENKCDCVRKKKQAFSELCFKFPQFPQQMRGSGPQDIVYFHLPDVQFGKLKLDRVRGACGIRLLAGTESLHSPVQGPCDQVPVQSEATIQTSAVTPASDHVAPESVGSSSQCSETTLIADTQSQNTLLGSLPKAENSGLNVGSEGVKSSAVQTNRTRGQGLRRKQGRSRKQRKYIHSQAEGGELKGNCERNKITSSSPLENRKQDVKGQTHTEFTMTSEAHVEIRDSSTSNKRDLDVAYPEMTQSVDTPDKDGQSGPSDKLSCHQGAVPETAGNVDDSQSGPLLSPPCHVLKDITQDDTSPRSHVLDNGTQEDTSLRPVMHSAVTLQDTLLPGSGERVLSVTCGQAILQAHMVDVVAACTHTWLFAWTYLTADGQWRPLYKKQLSPGQFHRQVCMVMQETDGMWALVTIGEYESGQVRTIMYHNGRMCDNAVPVTQQAGRQEDETVLCCPLVETGFCLARCGKETSVSSYTLHTDVSFCVSMTFDPIDKALHSLVAVDDIKDAVLGLSDSAIFIWSCQIGGLLHTVPITLGLHKCVAARASGGLLFLPVSCVEGGGCLVVVNPNTGKTAVINTWEASSRPVRCVELQLQGGLVYAVTDEGSLMMWNVYSGQLVCQSSQQHYSTFSMHPHKPLLLTGGRSGQLQVHSINTLPV